MTNFLRVLALALMLCFGATQNAFAQSGAVPETSNPSAAAEGAGGGGGDGEAHDDHSHAGDSHGGASHGKGEGGDAHAGSTKGAHGEKPKSPFAPHAGSWVNPIARGIANLFGANLGTPVRDDHDPNEIHYTNVQYDSYVVALLCSIGLIGFWTVARRGQKLRPPLKGVSVSSAAEAALESFRNYLVGVMGEQLALKYAPLISSFFFSILVFNLIGLVPGFIKPTVNLNIPIAMALFAFVCTHFIAIKEVGLKNYVMHYVGDPPLLGFLMVPLHIIGELIKPLSLAIRLFCNMFGEEMVVVKLAALALGAAAALGLPTFIPFQLPMLMLGTFFSFLQALVFATLLGIYIATMSTHEEHGHEGAHEHGHHPKSHGDHLGHGRAMSAEVPVA